MSEPVYGIIDPDYAKVFTVARCIAWAQGYALLMHGSFTRDLDLLAVPWTEQATDAEHLVKRIAGALDELKLLAKDPEAASQATEKPHGRLSWTLTFKTFGDPRFVDLGVMPRATAPAGKVRRMETQGGSTREHAVPLQGQAPDLRTVPFGKEREGWVTVPREPTPEMYGAGGVAQFKNDWALTPVRDAVGNVYRAMIAASPDPSRQEGEL